ncbi:uncharacterized protein LOC124146900 [Haliotis rufescens]|uniref:uncharacterized protein LOC124146900 n=1 Tax=Haliotis rufescens TaxID=6454 RepID=UPI00201F9078|nr:uncharacterized protein LOC124146900 [Haliotis rufescens]
MPTTTRYPRAPPVPLDLGDIKKTQRRVAALLSGATPRGGIGAAVHRKHIPHSFCYVCSRLGPDGRYMGNPYRYLFGKGYLQRCEHSPPAPHPTMLAFSPPNTPASEDGRFFDTAVLNKDTLPRGNKNRFQLPPMFEKDKQIHGEDGRFLPLVSENTFLTTNPPVSKERKRAAEGRLSLPSLTNEKRSMIGRNGELGGRSRSLSQDGSGVLNRNGSYTLGDGNHYDRRGSDTKSRNGDERRKKKPKEAFTHPSGIELWGEEDQMTGGTIKYKHGKKDDWAKYAGQSSPFKENIRENSNSRDLSFEFHRRGTFSLSPPGPLSISRETTLTTPDSFLFLRINSANWCECPDVDTALLRCKECFQTGGHEKWCVSKMGLCPQCGKPVRRKHAHGRLDRHRTNTPLPSPDKTATDLSSTSHNRRECSSKRKDGDHKVRFSEQNTFVKENKKDQGGILKHDTDVKTLSYREKLEITMKTKQRNKHNPALPKVDPNVHKQAYMLALADARIKKMKRDPWALENSNKRPYFSYFPLYKHPGYKPPQNLQLGIRKEDESKKVKIKKGMKHILGDIKLSDYYPPTGSKGVREQGVKGEGVIEEGDAESTRQL